MKRRIVMLMYDCQNYETDFPASERKTARQCFKELCNEFDPDKNPDLDESNLDDSILLK